MRKILFALVFWCILWACGDDPAFPDPGLDNTRTSVDTVRVDTIERYLISMRVQAPNGVENIQVLNGRNYEVVEEFPDLYDGQTDFVFEYSIDLTHITVDTTLHYVVKVLDKDMRSYNKGFTLRVLKHSSPDIIFVGNTSDTWGLVSPVFEIKALFETGLNTIKSYKVYFEEEVVDEATFEDAIHEFKYKHLFNLEMYMGREYEMRFELTDDKGTVGVKELTLVLVEAQRPVKVTVSTPDYSPKAELMFYYNPENDDLLDSIVYTNYRKVMEGSLLVLKGYYARHDFSYTQEGMVSQVAYASEDGNRLMEYSYIPGTTQLEGIHNVTYPDNDISVKDYYADGNVKSYIAGTTLLVDNIHYVDDINGEKQIFAEYWDGTFDPLESERLCCMEVTSIQIPTYFPALPPFWGDSKMEYLDELLFYKYVFAKVVNAETGEEESQLTCETDERGQIKRLRRSSKDLLGRETYTEYVFTYEDTINE